MTVIFEGFSYAEQCGMQLASMREDANGKFWHCAMLSLYSMEQSDRKLVAWSLPIGDLRCSHGVKPDYDENTQDSVAWCFFSKKTGWVKDDKD